ncbi:MAG: TrbG/VirB9 family P-type conjugative transfer protein [Inquilinus sp.]|uniref:TrbG/VirB9 family P-type conjugative transfer protein n=1 Tax=Inquilinus sp. TaxID=1932117 RepID=UPI003F3360EB
MTRSLRTLACALALLAGALSGTARAENIPNPGPSDPRMRWVVYNPDQVYKITGVYRASTAIVFAKDEQILNGAAGDTMAWEVSPVENVLFLKPRENLPATNLTVLTRRPDGSSRLYQFELSARDGAIGVNDPDTVFQVRFRYPDDEAAARRKKAAAAAAARAARRERQQVSEQLAAGSQAGVWNWAYAAIGDAGLEPAEISDNGRITVLRFPGNQPLSSIYAVDDDGNESLVQPVVRGPRSPSMPSTSASGCGAAPRSCASPTSPLICAA